VAPGDQLILKASFERNFKGIWRLTTHAEVDGEEVANALIMIAPDLKPGSAAAGTEDLP
jgi:3-hydroxyacyl-[acyl-carrier-protein] dehydratase